MNRKSLKAEKKWNQMLRCFLENSFTCSSLHTFSPLFFPLKTHTHTHTQPNHKFYQCWMTSSSFSITHQKSPQVTIAFVVGSGLLQIGFLPDRRFQETVWGGRNVKLVASLKCDLLVTIQLSHSMPCSSPCEMGSSTYCYFILNS